VILACSLPLLSRVISFGEVARLFYRPYRGCGSFVSLKLPTAPMMIFPIRIEHALNVAV
jgi:hypothetical protein